MASKPMRMPVPGMTNSASITLATAVTRAMAASMVSRSKRSMRGRVLAT